MGGIRRLLSSNTEGMDKPWADRLWVVMEEVQWAVGMRHPNNLLMADMELLQWAEWAVTNNRCNRLRLRWAEWVLRRRHSRNNFKLRRSNSRHRLSSSTNNRHRHSNTNSPWRNLSSSSTRCRSKQ